MMGTQMRYFRFQMVLSRILREHEVEHGQHMNEGLTCINKHGTAIRFCFCRSLRLWAGRAAAVTKAPLLAPTVVDTKYS